MANPSPQAVAAIRSKVSDWDPSNAAIAAALNAPDRANPVAQPQLAKPMTATALMGKLGKAQRAAIYQAAPIARFVEDIRAGDRMAVANWIQLAVDAGDLAAADQAALMAEILATIPDPSWPAQISWAAATLGRPADADDIAASRPGV